MTPRRARAILTGGLVLGGLLLLLRVPAATRQGVDYRLSTRTIPLSTKALEFWHRHTQYARLARDITQGLAVDEAKVMAVWEWTRTHIRPTPPGWPVVDDHILHIIIRGHGMPDQRADVFATLCTYAGVPAFWRFLREPKSGEVLVLSFAKIRERWAVFDVGRELIFRDAQGRFLDAQVLAEHPEMAALTAGDLRPEGIPYQTYVARLAPFVVPRPLRAELQMPGRRAWHEVQRVLTRGAQG